MTGLIWVVLVVLVLLLVVCGYGLVLLQRMQKSQGELQNDTTANRSALDSLKAEIAHLKSGQAELHELVKGVETASQVADERLTAVVSDLSHVREEQHSLASASLQGLPALHRSDFLEQVSFEEFFEPKGIVIDMENPSPKDRAWLTALLGSSNYTIKAFETVKTFTERYGEFPPELMESLKSGSGKLMESAEGARWTVMENGRILGHGVMRNSPTLAHGAASVFSSVTMAAYILVAYDTQKQLRSVNELLTSLNDDVLWSRQARLEAIYESLRRVSQSAFAEDRGTVLHLIKELHEIRSYLRRKIRAEVRRIKQPGFWRSLFQEAKSERERDAHFNHYRAELEQTHRIFQLEAFAVSILNDPNLDLSFIRSIQEEGGRLDRMHSEIESSWLGEGGFRDEQEQPAILADVQELSSLYAGSLWDALAVVIGLQEEVDA